jgi:hypothetical protein
VITAHYDAVKARLEEHIALDGKVFDTARVDADGAYVRANYLILFGGAPAEFGGDRQARRQVADDNAVFDYMLRAVGISAEAVRLLLEAAAVQFTAWIPEIPGRRCSAMHYPAQTPAMRTETSVKPPLLYADAEWVLRSNFVNGGS